MISQPMHGVNDLGPIERYTTSKVDDHGLVVRQIMNELFGVDDLDPKRDDERH